MREGNVREKVHRRYLLMPEVNVRKTEMMWKMTGIASYCFICRGGMNREKRLTLKKAMLLNESSQTAKTPSTKRKEKDSDASVLTNFKFFPESAKAP
ncbi:hypothetical protein MR060_02960 [bacterium]|nr:hypothetical protein [bacterium]